MAGVVLSWTITNRSLSTSTFAHIVESRYVKEVQIFEDFNDQFITIQQSVGPAWATPDAFNAPVISPLVSLCLAQVSTRLEKLSISFLVDATLFLLRCFCAQELTWDKLTSLALTSRELVPATVTVGHLNRLLRAATTFAVRAPKLKRLTLWNYHKEWACSFVYKIPEDGEVAKITWQTTWAEELSPATIDRWKEVAQYHGFRDLWVETKVLDAGVVLRSLGHAIKHMELSTEVIDAQSLQQMLRESGE